jgi:hypothetical protein
MTEFGIVGDVVIAGSRILVPVSVATVVPGVVVPVSGTVSLGGGTVPVAGTVQIQPARYVFTSVSGTVKGGPGVLYSVFASGESGLVAGAGTLLVLDGTATVAVVPVGAGGAVPVPFAPGVAFGTLIASVLGSVDATFVVM